MNLCLHSFLADLAVIIVLFRGPGKCFVLSNKGTFLQIAFKALMFVKVNFFFFFFKVNFLMLLLVK